MSRSLVLALGLVACGPPEFSTSADPYGCVPELPDPTRARAKQVVCNDELGDGDADRGDWLLQNSELTVFIRTERFALSQAGRAGGTVIDLFSSSGTMDVAELVPQLPDSEGNLDWFVDARISPIEDNHGAGIQVDGTLADGTDATVTWWLDHSGSRLEVIGTTDFLIAPRANAVVRADLLQYGDRLLGPGSLLEDRGGWLRWTDTTWFEVASESTLSSVLPDRYIQAIAGDCANGDLIYLADADGRILQRASLDGQLGEFSFLADDRATQIACYASGRARSDWTPLPAWNPTDEIPETIYLTVGDYGELSLQVGDTSGNPVPSATWWNGGRWILTTGEGVLPVGAGPGTGIVGGGPAYDTATFSDSDVGEDSTARAVLQRVLPEDVLLADFFVEAWPHPTSRTAAGTQIARRVALGVEWAITVGDNVVVSTDVSSLDRDEIWSSTGARSVQPHGTITSWPWSFNARANLWGAPDTTHLSPHEALALMGGGRGLTTIVDTTWVENAGPTYTWPQTPDALHLQSLDDLPVYIDLLDHWTTPALVGPQTWLDGVNRRTMAQVEAERALLERRTVATTGPLVRLSVQQDTPPLGEDIPPPIASLSVHAPTWMPVEHVALVGPGGAVLQEWSLGSPLDALRLQVDVELDPELPWVLAMAWSDRTVPDLQATAPWAVTSAVVLNGP